MNEDILVVPRGSGTKLPLFTTRCIAGKVYLKVWCIEHRRGEEVLRDRYHTELGEWYHLGLHPRFSPLEALRKAGQQREEIRRLVGGAGRDEQATREVYLKALSASRTPEELLENFHPILFTDLRAGDRNSRVTNAFKKRFDEKSFTVDEFLAEESQELRRLMIRSGLPIKDVLARMKFIAKDEEGELYEMEWPQTAAPRRVGPFGDREEALRYLHVTCPSTGAEYLLGVPLTLWEEENVVRLDSPKIARRWTFDLPPGAEFVKEA